MKSIFKFLIIISSVYFTFIYLNAATISDIKIEGNKRVVSTEQEVEFTMLMRTTYLEINVPKRPLKP